MKAKTKRSGAAGVRKRSAAKDLTTEKDAKAGIIAVLTGLAQAPGASVLAGPSFAGGVMVASGDVNGDGNALKLKR